MNTFTGLLVAALALVAYAEAQKYNLGEVLQKSILFYEAQRSGKLPASNRIPWRGDSALQDGSDVGIDLTGGWYDAGDHVKFNFPGSATVTMLISGMLRYKAAYQSINEWENALDSIKWPLDFFIKCHTKPNELYMQVGNGTADHKFWGRAEDMTMARPTYKITADLPGSDLAGETAAAMASGYLAFKDSNADYAAELLRHARELYTFANTYRGKYSDSVPQVRAFYGSSSYGDELALAAIWLYKATGEASYLQQAKEHIASIPAHREFSWDTKTIGAALLIYEADSSDANSKQKIEYFVDQWLNKVTRTPKGLAWLTKWGPNRYSANAVFGMLMAADLGFETAASRQFAKQQIDYILGDNGRSYVCGFGNNPPVRPHHRSSSCPLMPAPCGWRQFNAPGPNPQVLYGALAGGPDVNDFYEDKRNDYIKNEVAVDYNSGFQSAVAGLIALSMQ